MSGHAVVQRDGTPLGLMGQGDSWSEHSLLNHQRSPISVVALSPVVVLASTTTSLTSCWRSRVSAAGSARAATAGGPALPSVYRGPAGATEWADEKRLRRELAELGPL